MINHFILIAEVKQNSPIYSDEVNANLKKVATVINKLHKKHFITQFDSVLKNEIQAITNDLQGSLEIIFDIEECIIENNLDFKLKYVLYHDVLETPQSKYVAYERLGFGLINAREQLSLIKKTDSRFLIVTTNERQSLQLNNLFLIYEDYVDSWKIGDFELVSAFMNHKNYKEVAALFNMNTSSGWRREKSLKLKQYHTVKEMILSSIE